MERFSKYLKRIQENKNKKSVLRARLRKSNKEAEHVSCPAVKERNIVGNTIN